MNPLLDTSRRAPDQRLLLVGRAGAKRLRHYLLRLDARGKPVLTLDSREAWHATQPEAEQMRDRLVAQGYRVSVVL